MMGAERHLRWSLACVAVFAGLGLGLEGLHALRDAAWMDDALRRAFLRLGHAHGAVLALVNVAIAWALERLETPPAWARRIRLAALLGALAVAIGFVGGGLWHGPTDPGPLVVLVPAGALTVIAALLAIVAIGPRV